ncbi:hypothetical protein AMATHDRAFT_1194 [Amanita thiersii Skay4041]|uniref:Small ribosomal subunit protein uS7 domain-containing protein n=1 Tax=Amanita thiersii Skay4041 TaxID=703135 RepID=A0A2A9NZK9_9AGAR|nr:hypothetical protein AMATHDRAFT_1194 [Amanita thiersii Skay4041]
MLPCLRHAASVPPRRICIRAFSGADFQRILSQTLDPIAQSTPVETSPQPSPSIQHEVEIPPSDDPLLHYLTSCIMRRGRRARASRTTSKVLLYLHTLTRAPPLPIFRKAIEMASPAVRVVNNKTGAKVIPTPLPLSEKQRTRYAVEWILAASDSKPGITLEERLARELIAVVKGKSSALDKKEAVHRTAMVNRGNIRATRM